MRKALLAEDNPNNQLVLRRMLEHCGLECTVVENGAEAVEAVTGERAARQKFDLVLLDLQMPVMDGLTAVRQLRAHFSGRPGRPAFLAVTANAFAQDEKEALDAGFDFYLAKPVSLPQLQSLLDKAGKSFGGGGLHGDGADSPAGGH